MADNGKIGGGAAAAKPAFQRIADPATREYLTLHIRDNSETFDEMHDRFTRLAQSSESLGERIDNLLRYQGQLEARIEALEAAINGK